MRRVGERARGEARRLVASREGPRGQRAGRALCYGTRARPQERAEGLHFYMMCYASTRALFCTARRSEAWRTHWAVSKLPKRNVGGACADESVWPRKVTELVCFLR